MIGLKYLIFIKYLLIVFISLFILTFVIVIYLLIKKFTLINFISNVHTTHILQTASNIITFSSFIIRIFSIIIAIIGFFTFNQYKKIIEIRKEAEHILEIKKNELCEKISMWRQGRDNRCFPANVIGVSLILTMRYVDIPINALGRQYFDVKAVDMLKE